MKKINICLSTYNGERYLSEQIESILSQSYKNWQLLIRDDGSKDNTINIINKFTEKDSRIKFINKDNIENLGVHKSFYTIVKYESADFYFFCDQDDVWKPDKLDVFLSYMEENDNSVPVLYYSSLTTVDSELNVISERMFSRSKAMNITENLVKNEIVGCVTAINSSLANEWLYSGIGMHDSHLALLALSTGKLVYIKESTIYYRQHENNVIGASNKKNPIQQFWQMINTSQNRAKFIIDNNTLETQEKMILWDFYNLKNEKFFKRISTIKKYAYNRGSLPQNIVLWTLLSTNYGRKQIS